MPVRSSRLMPRWSQREGTDHAGLRVCNRTTELVAIVRWLTLHNRTLA